MLRTPRLMARLLVILLLTPILSPFFASVGLSEAFTYASERLTLSAQNEQIQTVTLARDMTSFTMALASATPIINEDSVAITITSAGVSKSVGLEISGDEDGIYYTAPLHFEPTSTLSVECKRE